MLPDVELVSSRTARRPGWFAPLKCMPAPEHPLPRGSRVRVNGTPRAWRKVVFAASASACRNPDERAQHGGKGSGLHFYAERAGPDRGFEPAGIIRRFSKNMVPAGRDKT